MTDDKKIVKTGIMEPEKDDADIARIGGFPHTETGIGLRSKKTDYGQRLDIIYNMASYTHLFQAVELKKNKASLQEQRSALGPPRISPRQAFDDFGSKYVLEFGFHHDASGVYGCFIVFNRTYNYGEEMALIIEPKPESYDCVSVEDMPLMIYFQPGLTPFLLTAGHTDVCWTKTRGAAERLQRIWNATRSMNDAELEGLAI